jgi:hypothetical protein
MRTIRTVVGPRIIVIAVSCCPNPPPLYNRCIRVLHFEPIGRAAGTIGGVFALRDNPFEAEPAGVAKYGFAIALHMLVESDA